MAFFAYICDTMFKKNNNMWMKRSKSGRDKIFATPELMMAAFQEYMKQVDSSPWYEYDFKVVDKELTEVSIPKKLPYTIMGFMLFCHVNEAYWRQFKKGTGANPENDFSTVMATIENTCFSQKFAGAAAGFFNANIIARDLGLRDQQDIKITKIGKELADEEYVDDGN